MGGVRGFHHITPEEIAWRTELGNGDPDYVELIWFDAVLDNGWQLGVGLYRSRPHDSGRPAVTINLLRPGLPYLEEHLAFDASGFVPAEFGGSWGGTNRLDGVLDRDGLPESFRLEVAAGAIEVDLACEVVCPGVKFTSASPGYTHHRPESGTAVGWWPVAPRAEATGSVTVDGEVATVSGPVHLEKQLSSLPLAGGDGSASAQSTWTWGHFVAGEYTGFWTDSTASAQLGNRHFAPFVLYRGTEPVLSSFGCASSVVRFTVEEATGLPRPEVVTLRAIEGDREFFARLVGGQVSDQFELNGNAGAFYCRQVGRIEAEFRHWGRDRFTGDVVHEWGTQAGNFPFAARH